MYREALFESLFRLHPVLCDLHSLHSDYLEQRQIYKKHKTLVETEIRSNDVKEQQLMLVLDNRFQSV
jgi:hypothetical protein